MRTEKVNSLLAEIISSQGFINIDKNDIDTFKANFSEIDAEKVAGKVEEIGFILDHVIYSIKTRNDSKQIKGLIFIIRLSQDNCFMGNINDIHDVIDKLDENLEYKWGISIMDNLQSNQFELIVVIGF